MTFILDVDHEAAREKLGAKAAALSELDRAGLPVPPWFVLSPDAFSESARGSGCKLEDLFDDDTDGDPGQKIRPSAEVRVALARALEKLCANQRPVAVRSSMPDEDGQTRSFAGQFESYLGVRPEEVPDRVADVWRSAFGQRAAHYRASHGAANARMLPPVLVQRMIEADAAGVAFSADPVSGQRGVAVVAATRGLGCALVNGGCEGDEYKVDRAGRILLSSIARKCTAYRLANGPQSGVEAYALSPESASAPALSEEQVRAIAALARRCAHHFGVPQDIEWAIAEGELFLLQSRPITSLTLSADPDGCLAVWDNSNIAESYTGVTTPLTFSFVRLAYSHVYRELCRLGGVEEATISANEPALRSMIGLARGRIYYNLLSWYQLLALTPGFRHNRAYLDQMLGLREEVRAEALERLDCRHNSSRLRRLWSTAVFVTTALINHANIERRIARFNQRVDEALKAPRMPLEGLRADELVTHWHELVRMLLRKWDAPLVNDYFAMFFHGALGRLVQRWFPESDRGLANRLLQGEGNVISVEPARRLLEMADLARTRPEWPDRLRRAPKHLIERNMADFPEFQAQYRAYIADFGDRCLDELKLESPTLHDDPLPLLRSIGELARIERTGSRSGSSTREAAERRAREVLGATPVRRVVFRWILRNARSRVRDRENLRFQRTRVFGRVRRIFVELGRRLHALDLLEQPRDVFYLEVDEILGFVEGTITCTDLRGLVAIRKTEFARYREMEAPAERFETRGMVHHGNTFRACARTVVDHMDQSGETRTGQPGSSGRIQGRVRIVKDPRGARLGQDEILVAERTDPGWVVLFSGVKGLLIEHGSLLSHTAIVARELGIPTVIGIAGATEWLSDGDLVELDGDSGSVKRFARVNGKQAA